jgi:Branched-chain amino acid ATP-binding cassette transporter
MQVERNAAIALSGSAAEFREHPEVRRAYLGEGA